MAHSVIALLQCRGPKPIPNILPVHRPRHLQCNLQVPALDRQIEPRLLVLDEVKRDLGISLLLEVPDDALPNEIAVPDDLEDFIVVLADQSEFEAVLRRIDGDGARPGSTVEAMHDLAFDTGEVDGLVKSLDYAVITESLCKRSHPGAPDSPLR